MYGIPSHITRFICNLKQTNQDVAITLLSDRDKQEFPQEMHACICEYIQAAKFTLWKYRMGFLRPYFDFYSFKRQVKELSVKKHYDIVNIHYPIYSLCYMMKYFRNMANSIIVSPWGSDVLRVNDPKEKKRLTRVFNGADYITTRANGPVGKVLCQEMNISENKFHPTGWGSETIDYINDHITEVSNKKAKELLHLNGRYLITCGYNAFREQRHEIIIDAIQTQKDLLPNNLTLLFPVTYGTSYGTAKQEYVDHLKKKCEELKLPVVFYENYLSVAELFLLRRATDMFIHVQTTDAGNSSLQEYVLCGAKVVHGSWIHYDNLEQYTPLFYYPVYDLDSLGNVIVNAYSSEPIKTPEQVIRFIQNRGWKAKMQLWNTFFISCLNN